MMMVARFDSIFKVVVFQNGSGGEYSGPDPIQIAEILDLLFCKKQPCL